MCFLPLSKSEGTSGSGTEGYQSILLDLGLYHDNDPLPYLSRKLRTRPPSIQRLRSLFVTPFGFPPPPLSRSPFGSLGLHERQSNVSPRAGVTRRLPRSETRDWGLGRREGFWLPFVDTGEVNVDLIRQTTETTRPLSREREPTESVLSIPLPVTPDLLVPRPLLPHSKDSTRTTTTSSGLTYPPGVSTD